MVDDGCSTEGCNTEEGNVKGSHPLTPRSTLPLARKVEKQSGCSNSYDAYSVCGNQDSNRSPDYLSLNLGASFPGLGAVLSGQLQITLDRFGNIYMGPGIALGPEAPVGFSASLNFAGYIVPDSTFKEGGMGVPPGEKRSEEILSGGFGNGALCFGVCTGATKSLSQPYTGLDLFGIGVPQFSLGGGYTWLFDFTSNNGEPIWEP
jgi:hypothetical protein